MPPILPSKFRDRDALCFIRKKLTAYLALESERSEEIVDPMLSIRIAPSLEDPAAVPVAALKISVLVPSSLAGAGSSFQLLLLLEMIQ